MTLRHFVVILLRGWNFFLRVCVWYTSQLLRVYMLAHIPRLFLKEVPMKKLARKEKKFNGFTVGFDLHKRSISFSIFDKKVMKFQAENSVQSVILWNVSSMKLSANQKITGKIRLYNFRWKLAEVFCGFMTFWRITF